MGVTRRPRGVPGRPRGVPGRPMGVPGSHELEFLPLDERVLAWGGSLKNVQGARWCVGYKISLYFVRFHLIVLNLMGSGRISYDFIQLH